jgi:hypothetical protein
MTTKRKDVCKVKGCGEPAFSRGLCNGHHRTAAEQVKTRKTTWAELEEFGLADPPKRPGRKSKFTEQLLKAREKASSK